MPIKFGDLIENANSAYAVIDLTDNQSRGVAFIDAFGALSGGVSTALTNVTLDKRKQGMLLVDKESAEVFLLEGAPADAGAGYTDSEFGTAPGETGSKWKAVGSLELQTEDIAVNIDDAKSFGKYTPAFTQTIGGTEYTAKIPVAAWMTEAAASNPAPIASASGATSLEIIRDALNEVFTLQPTINAAGNIQFNEPSGTIDLSASCNNVNETTCTNFKFYVREPGGSYTLLSTVPTANVVNGNDATAVTWTATATHTWDVGANQFDDFEGFEYKVEVLDAFGSTGSAEDDVDRGDYFFPQVSNFTVERQFNNTIYNGQFSGTNDVNESDNYRVLGNIDSDISFTITPSTSNDTSITGGSHSWRLLRKNTAEGVTSDWNQIKTGTFTLGGASSHTVTTTDEGDQSLSTLANKVQYCVLVLDIFTDTDQSATNSALINYSSSQQWLSSSSNTFQIPGSTGSGVSSSYSATPTSSSNYSGHLSEQIRFVAPQFAGYIPEATIGTGSLPISAVSQSHIDALLTYQFGSDFNDVATLPADAIGNINSPYLLKFDFPKQGNTQGASGAYSLNSITGNGGGRFYMILHRQRQGSDSLVPGIYDKDGSGLTDYSSSTADYFDPRVGSTSAVGQIFCNGNDGNQNTAFSISAAGAPGDSDQIKIVGRRDAQGNAMASRTNAIQYYVLLGNQSNNVSQAPLKLAVTE
jgi:hypothetical protein